MPSQSESEDPPGGSTLVSSPTIAIPFLVPGDDSPWVAQVAPRDDGVTVDLNERLANWARSPRQTMTTSTSLRRRGSRMLRAGDIAAGDVRRPYRLGKLVGSTLNVSRFTRGYVRGTTKSATGAHAVIHSRCLFESGQWDCTGEGCHHLVNRPIAAGVSDGAGTRVGPLGDVSGNREGPS